MLLQTIFLSDEVCLLDQPLCKAGMSLAAKYTIKWGIRNPEKLLITTVIHIPHRLCSAQDLYELGKGHGLGEAGPVLLDPMVFN